MKIARWLVSVCMMCLIMGAAHAELTRNADIEQVIDQQIAAFQVDDFKGAFDFAAPNIQARFGTPEKFGFAVIHGYPMVWRCAGIQYIGIEQHGGRALQKVMLTDQHQTLHMLIYQMRKIDKNWRISGVQIILQPKSDA